MQRRQAKCSFRCFNGSPHVIHLTAMMCIGHRISLANSWDIKSLQQSTSVYASIRTCFNLDRHLYSGAVFKRKRAIAPAEWRRTAD